MSFPYWSRYTGAEDGNVLKTKCKKHDCTCWGFATLSPWLTAPELFGGITLPDGLWSCNWNVCEHEKTVQKRWICGAQSHWVWIKSPLLVLHQQQYARQEWYGLVEKRSLSSLLQGGALWKPPGHSLKNWKTIDNWKDGQENKIIVSPYLRNSSLKYEVSHGKGEWVCSCYHNRHHIRWVAWGLFEREINL